MEDPREAEPKQPRRNFNETNTSHPGEYWGYKEMEKGEGFAHSTAWNIVKIHTICLQFALLEEIFV